MPAEYQEVDYIESTGTQYIETQIFPKINDVIVIDVQNTSNSSSEQAIMGVREASAGKAIDFYYQSGKPIFWIDYSGSESVGPNESYYNEKIRYEASYNSSGMQLKINDNTYSKTKVFGDAAFTGPYYIFAYNASGTPSAKFSGRIYNIEIYSDGELAHKFQPCYRISDNEIGLYDKIEGKFYVNKGTGNFKKENDTGYITPSTELIDNKDHTLYAVWGHNPTVTFDANGGNVSPSTKTYDHDSKYTDLPVPTRSGYTFLGWKEYDFINEYRVVDWIESNGFQYIYTSLSVNENDEFETKSSTNSTGNYHTIIGSASGRAFELYYNIPNVATYSNISILSGQTTSINSGEAYIHRTKATSNSSNFEIFSYNKQYNLNGKIYYVKWFRNGELIHNFIPCYRISDNTIGLFDTVDGVFYTNNGTGMFSKGSVNQNYITSSTRMITNDNHTLYAVWGHNPIVAFDANGGSVSLSTKTYEYNSNYTDLPVPTRYGYIFKGWEKYDLPSGYQAIDYLESKGSQYIYTDLGVNENDEFETKSSTNSTGNYHTIIGSASGAVFELYYNIPNVATYGTISILSGQTTGINSGEAYIHRTKATSNSSNFEIFSYNKQYNLNGKIYYVKWFRNGELIHNFIPCVRVKDDVEGLFEINSNVFYVNSGSGTFTRGSNIYNSDLFSTVDSTNIVIEQNHTLYAKWEKEE